MEGELERHAKRTRRTFSQQRKLSVSDKIHAVWSKIKKPKE
jgi:hypothetical protein